MAFGAGQHLKSLIEQRAVLDAHIADLKAKRAEIEAAIAGAAGVYADEGYKKANKVDGTVRFSLDGEDFKSDIRKTVKWDSDSLLRIAASLPFDEAQKLFAVEYSIRETIFKTLPPDSELRARLMDARTVSYGEPKITIVEK